MSVAYPDSYPHLRPVVLLLGADAEVSRKHISPTTSEICLLGRDTRQWNSDWTLAKLLVEQLGAALNNGEDHVPQGDPVEVWWNGLAIGEGDSFCIVDSDWRPAHPGPGTLDLLIDFREGKPSSRLRACVVKAKLLDETFEGSMTPPLAGLGKAISIPWVHLADTLVPGATSNLQISKLIGDHPNLRDCVRQKFDGYIFGRMIALS
ncbi:MAG: hypothetical protein ACRYGP_01255 [Janthinobacterium lividum]